MKSQGDKQEHVTLILGLASPGRKSGLRERKLGSGGGGGGQSGVGSVWTRPEACGGPAWGIAPGGGDPRSAPAP